MPQRTIKLTDEEALSHLSLYGKHEGIRSIEYAWVKDVAGKFSFFTIKDGHDGRFVWTLPGNAFERLLERRVIIPLRYELFDGDFDNDLSVDKIMRHGKPDPNGGAGLQKCFVPHTYSQEGNGAPLGLAKGWITVRKRANKNIQFTLSDLGERIDGTYVVHFVHHNLLIEPATR